MEKEKQNEKNLTPAEQRRLEHFEQTAEEMVRQGYVRQDLTVDIRKANWFGIFLMFPLLIIGYGLYYLIHRRMEFAASSLLIFLLAFFGCIVLHELIHGLSWSIFTPHHFRDVEFGVMRSSLTPYCACTVPLKRSQYIFGALMPMVVVGIVPLILGLVIASPGLLLLGIAMTDAAAGDLMIVRNVLGFKEAGKEVVYMDHPTEAGGVVFVR